MAGMPPAPEPDRATAPADDAERERERRDEQARPLQDAAGRAVETGRSSARTADDTRQST